MIDPALAATPPAGATSAGQSDEVTKPPVAPTPADTGFASSKPLLMIGAAGPDVAELGYLLAGHGFANTVSDGTASAPPILDDALMRVVVDFQHAKGVDPWTAEDGGSPAFRYAHIGVVDARTWEALLEYQPHVIPNGATSS